MVRWQYLILKEVVLVKKWAYPLAIVTFFCFLFLWMNYEKPTFVDFDNRMSEFLGGNAFLISFHYLGDTVFVVTVALLLLVVLWLRERNYRGMLFVILTFAAGNGLNQVLKKIIERPRPEITDQLTSFSFPSGHSMTGILYLFALAYLLTEVSNNGKKKIAIWIAAVVLTCCIGMARVAESRHFATDVLAGWSMGYTWFILCVIWYEYRKRQFKKMQQERLVK